MELLPQDLRAQLPPLGSCEEEVDPIVRIKFYLPGTVREWYVIEGSPAEPDFCFFGYVRGRESDWRYFPLSELEQKRGPDGQRVERAMRFEPGPFHDLVSPPEE